MAVPYTPIGVMHLKIVTKIKTPKGLTLPEGWAKVGETNIPSFLNFGQFFFFFIEIVAMSKTFLPASYYCSDMSTKLNEGQSRF